MSIEAVSYALNLSVHDSTRKLVLVGLANHAHADGTAIFPGVNLVAGYADCSPRTVRRHVGWLLEHGYIREGDQALVSHYDPRRRPIVYDMAMTEAERTEWEADYARTGGDGRRKDKADAGRAGAEKRWGDNLTGQSVPTSRGDNLAGQDDPSRPVTGDGFDLSSEASRPVTGDSQTVLEPSKETVHLLPSTADAVEATHPGDASERTDADPFDAFWRIYPRKVGKTDAEKMFRRAAAKVGAEVILAGARRFAADPNLPPKHESQFIAHPATWLNRGSWDDEPLPPRLDTRGRTPQAPAYDDNVWNERELRETMTQGLPAPDDDEGLDRVFFGRSGA